MRTVATLCPINTTWNAYIRFLDVFLPKVIALLMFVFFCDMSYFPAPHPVNDWKCLYYILCFGNANITDNYVNTRWEWSGCVQIYMTWMTEKHCPLPSVLCAVVFVHGFFPLLWTGSPSRTLSTMSLSVRPVRRLAAKSVTRSQSFTGVNTYDKPYRYTWCETPLT